jgi:hypothetical protein
MKKTQRNKKARRITMRKRGGILGALSVGTRTNKPGADNISYITTVVYKGRFFSSKNTYNIEYIIPNNFILLNDPSSFLTPTFCVYMKSVDTKKKLSYKKIQDCSFQVEEPNNPSNVKFIEYFIKVDNNWYAMMRIYGLINTGVFASLNNILFYKLPSNWFVLKKNQIIITPSDVVKVDPKNLNFSQKITLSQDDTILKLNTMNLNKKYSAVTTGDIFYILRKFRNEKIINAGVKQEALNETVNEPIFKAFNEMFGL